jgi:hypothetical protein
LDAYPKTVNTFVNVTNDVLKTYEHEFVAAIAGGTIVALEREMVRIFLSRIVASRTDEKRQSPFVRARLKWLRCCDGKPKTVADLITRIIRNAHLIDKYVQEAAECGMGCRPSKHVLKEHDSNPRGDQQIKSAEAQARLRAEVVSDGGCTGCGMLRHGLKDYRLTQHPHFNKSSQSWATSTIGLRYAAQGKTQLKYGQDQKDNKIVMPTAAPKKPFDKAAKKQPWQSKKGKCTLHIDAPYFAALCAISDPSYFIAGSLRGTHNITNTLTPPAYMQVNSLLDTGAVLGNYCFRVVDEWVRQHHLECWRTAESVEEIALATEGASTTSLGSCFIDLILKDKNSGITHTLANLRWST